MSSGGYIGDNAFPAAPPCPQTPKPPNHQETGRYLKLFSHARPLKGRRIIIIIIIIINIISAGAGDREAGVYKDGPCSSCSVLSLLPVGWVGGWLVGWLFGRFVFLFSFSFPFLSAPFPFLFLPFPMISWLKAQEACLREGHCRAQASARSMSRVQGPSFLGHHACVLSLCSLQIEPSLIQLKAS